LFVVGGINGLSAVFKLSEGFCSVNVEVAHIGIISACADI